MTINPTAIYLDNASTSYPKPRELSLALSHFYDEVVGSYGRSLDNHTLEVCAIIEELRDLLARRIGAEGMGSHITFTHHATDAINRVINGLPHLSPQEVIISPMEHNAVTRPLYAKLKGARPIIMPSHTDGSIDLDAFALQLEKYHLKLAVINGMSNVNGMTPALEESICLLRQKQPQCRILLDASQAFPYIPALPRKYLPDFIALTGHKGSLGPTGTGALFILDPESIGPSVLGGNGYRSEIQEPSSIMPDRFEAGTLNMLGLSAWYAALQASKPSLISQDQWIAHIKEIQNISGIQMYCAKDIQAQGPLYSIRSAKFSPAQLGDVLYKKYHILTRSGLHCAPLAHQTLGTLPEGTTRISISSLTPNSYLEDLTKALYELHQH